LVHVTVLFTPITTVIVPGEYPGAALAPAPAPLGIVTDADAPPVLLALLVIEDSVGVLVTVLVLVHPGATDPPPGASLTQLVEVLVVLIGGIVVLEHVDSGASLRHAVVKLSGVGGCIPK
jgi:hypothetical protein